MEIEATSFANLLEDMPLRPLPLGVHVSGILLWGLAVGVLSFVFRPAVSFPAVAALSALYLGAAVHRFTVEAAWYPVVFPLLVQGPMVLLGSVAWNYVELNRERRNFRRALADYLPAGVVDDLAKNIEGLRVGNRLVNGICLATDAERYTALAESMEPKDLAQLMNRYYEAVFDPVRRHGGMVSNVVGDSMLALWLATKEDPAPLNDASGIRDRTGRGREMRNKKKEKRPSGRVRSEPGNALPERGSPSFSSSFGRLDEALDEAQKASAQNPGIARTQTVLGFAYLAQVKTRDSRDAFERAIGLDQGTPSRAWVWGWRRSGTAT